ncbi:FHA domain-containing protein [bacterium]|nr:FHA domain-containing protein [bacterium]
MPKDVVAAVIINKPDGKQERFVLKDQDELRIGREESNDILISESGVSRFHATLSASTNGVVLSDLASLNGTFVNGVKLSGMRDVSSTDKVQIGATKIRLELTTEGASPESRSSRARAMTAQMRPISVSVLVLRLVPKVSDDELSEQVRAVTDSWIASVKEVIEEFDGIVDKKLGASIVALWIGDDPKNQALRAIRACQRTQERTAAELPDFQAQGAIASGLGLRGAPNDTAFQDGAVRGVDVHSVDSAGARHLNIVGDPINIAFQIAELHSQTEASVLLDKQTGIHIKSTLDLASIGEVDGFDDPLFTVSSHPSFCR